jgi:hypothetical protein
VAVLLRLLPARPARDPRRTHQGAKARRCRTLTASSFLELQNAVIKNGFSESDRSDAKTWINFRYGWIYGLEEWTFRRALASVTYAAGDNTLNGLPSEYQVAIGLQLSDGTEVDPLDWVEFNRSYYGSGLTGTPANFTVVGGSVYLGPTPSVSGTGQMLFLRGLAHKNASGTVVAGPMSDDDDVPLIPAEHHLSLVHGGKGSGFRLTNVPMASQLEQDFSNAITAMRANYLDDLRAPIGALPADPIAFL